MTSGQANSGGEHRPAENEEREPLPSRRDRNGRELPPPPMVTTDADPAAIKALLHEVREQVQYVNGLLLATQDGLVVGADTRGVHDDSVAAMAAAAAGLAAQFTAQAAVGQPRSSIFEGAKGYVGVFPAETAMLLVVFGEPDTSMGLFNVAARQVLGQVGQGLARQQVLNIRQTRRRYFEHSTPPAERPG